MAFRLGQRGQATVMIGMMLMTFIMLFAFVVNTGMLVNAKINLQNAADLAAYAGASVQARQLNQISFLNYDMRRQYKKFLFRYYVLGGMAQETNPRTPARKARLWSPSVNPTVNEQVPSVCVILSEKDNYCGVPSLPGIKLPKASTFDAINTTLRDAVAKIEKLRQGTCKGISYSNVQVLLLWLFNTDPDVSELQRALANVGGADAQEQRERIELMKNLTSGLGVVPRELLHAFRVQTLAEYVNEIPKTAVNRNSIVNLENAADIARHERTIQAFYSAYNTLGNHTFGNIEDIVLDELLPEGNAGAQVLDLQPIKIGFDAYTTVLALRDSPNESPSVTCQKDSEPQLAGDALRGKACVRCPTPFSINPDSLPVGFRKNPNVLTYYAVRLQAPAKVMFSPFGDMTLRAYAAAQPFGSRIGPNLSPAQFLRKAVNPIFCGGIGAGTQVVDCVGSIPNLAVTEDEDADTGAGWGWDREDVQYAMYRSLALSNSGAQPGNDPQSKVRISADEIVRAYESAMAPNPWEKGKYNIPVYDAAQDPRRAACQPVNPQMAYLCDYFAEYFDEKGNLAFWAPLISADKLSQGDLEQQVREAVMTLTKPAQPGAARTVFTPAFKEALIRTLAAYIQKIQQGPGEGGEGFHIARISDTLNHWAPGGALEPIRHKADGILLEGADPGARQPKNIKTSWNDVLDAAWEKEGRTGYSVKYVSFKYLVSPGQGKSDGATQWTNTSNLANELADDLELIQH